MADNTSNQTSNANGLSHFTLRSILEKDKLNGTNFVDWLRFLRVVLKHEKKLYVIENPPPNPPARNASAEVRAAYEKHQNDSLDVSCLMLASMTPELLRDHEDMNAWDMIQSLKSMFQIQARQERFDTVRALHACMMTEGSSVSTHVLKMKGYVDRLTRLGYPLGQELATDLVLNSLSKSYDQFVLNYNMNGLEKTLTELHGMLKTTERNMNSKLDSSKSKQVLMIKPKSGVVKKKRAVTKGKAKVGSSNKGKGKGKIPDDAVCFNCNQKGHWKRNCPALLAEMKKQKAIEAGTSGMFTIDLFTYDSDSWVLDTGCGTHICTTFQGLRSEERLKPGQMELRMGNGAKVAAVARGIYDLELPNGLTLSLSKCLFVPSITRNIVSFSQLRKAGFMFIFSDDDSILAYLHNVLYFVAKPHNGIYEIDLQNSRNYESMYNVNNKRIKRGLNQTYLWHCRLGHINKKRIAKLQADGVLDPCDDSYDVCESCLMGKMTKAPFKGKPERATELLEIIHTDVCGPFSLTTRNGHRYFITFTDDFSRFGYVYLMRNKSESFDFFKEFQNEVENQLGKKIKRLRSDRGREYLSQEFIDHLREHGIVSQLTPPGTPQHNGVSERRNRTLLDMVRSMMSRTTLPKSFWGYALETAARILNNAPTKKTNKTPYELWTGKIPKVSYMKIWGCEAYVKREASSKLDPRSEKCIFVGYPKETIGYYFYKPSENKVFVARRGDFLENDFLTRTTTGDTIDLEEIQEPQDETMVDTDNQHDVEPQQDVEGNNEIQTIRRSSRNRQEPERYGYLIGSDDTVDDEPVTYREAVSGLESDKWHDAMKAEIQSMLDNQVWDLVDAPIGCKVVRNKWVFKKKTDMDGIVHTYKARLVAKGFTQTQGVDYDETFSPVAMIKSIRILLAIAAYHDYEIWQMDVKTAFLNGTLSEDVYMVQPEGFEHPKFPEKVCKLQRSIYGLKQASRNWNLRFDEKIKEFGFLKNEDEPCVYKKVSGSIVVFLILYVDDILIIGNNIPTLESVKAWLGKCFAMKDLGEAAYILGIKIYRDRSRRLIGLSQSTYIDKILKRFKMEGSKRGNLPMVHGVHLSKTQCPSSKEDMNRMKGVPYASAIGSIMYAMLCTRPDVSYALSMTSRYQSNPGDAHWVAVKNILKYLRRTKDMFLLYGGQERDLCIQGYTDASFQTDRDDYKSQSGYVFVLNGGAVSWKSYKQSTIADSTTESEYIAASDAAKEAVWMKKFITDLGVVRSICDPVKIYCDNEGAIAQAKEPRSHQRSKHIMRRYHLIREIIERGDVKICKVRSEDNPADPLTKPLSQSKHDAHISSIGLSPSWKCTGCNQSRMHLSVHKVLDKTHNQDHLIDRRHKGYFELALGGTTRVRVWIPVEEIYFDFSCIVQIATNR
ncbi:hypothetical protein OSB04_020355 [Centaurea solstitialis]|uniref:Polyprotein n=1 Tax=Centaurea solstitialis TaxID=347529 RepID=A0AA38TAI1_9ASTR|nr:hypothetical protein OSB04_020355 [Centaurea solstitialis]